MDKYERPFGKAYVRYGHAWKRWVVLIWQGEACIPRTYCDTQNWEDAVEWAMSYNVTNNRAKEAAK